MLRILEQWLRLLFTGAALCLALEFMLRLFAPGNTETAWLFRTLHSAQPWLDMVCYYLTQPVDKIAGLVHTYAPWLMHWVPSDIQRLFPLMPAHVAAKSVAQILLIFPHDPHGRYAQDIINAPYRMLFPGVVDWRLLAALPLWSWAESMASGIIQWLETQLYRHSLRQQHKSAVQALQQAQ